MKIALVGITGKIGSQIALEAKKRGHSVTGISRHKTPTSGELALFPIAIADIFDQRALAAAAKGHDILASAFGPPPDAISTLPDAARALVAAARAAGIKRVIVVGGAGSLEVSPGVQLVDTAGFPDMYKPYALAHRDALAVCAQRKIWTGHSLPRRQRSVRARKRASSGWNRNLIADVSGQSRISYGDYADAFVSEIETGRYLKEIATAAY